MSNARAQVKAYIKFNSVVTCPPFTAKFEDSSVGNPDTWVWDFGNGKTSTVPSNSVIYESPGYYTVKLKVQKGLSIDSTYKIIHVIGASAAFSYTYTDACNVPVNFRFFVDSSHAGTDYHWNFNTNDISIEQNPTRSFTIGKYQVTLKSISEEGCIDSVIKTIQVGSAEANSQAPEAVCVKTDVIFTNISSVEPLSATWTINNMVFKTGKDSAVYQFMYPGTFTIQLTEEFGSCKDKLTKKIIVYDKPIASFSTSGVLQSCTYPSIVHFLNESSGAVACKWYFGDGDSSIENSPTHTYTAGKFSPMLVVFNASGCNDTLQKTDLVLLGAPVINSYAGIPFGGCVPFKISPVLNISTPEPSRTKP